MQPIQRQSRDEIAAVFWGLSKPLQTAAFTERLFCHVETAEHYSVERFVALHRSLSPFLGLAQEKQTGVADNLTKNLRALVGPTIQITRLSAAHIFQRLGLALQKSTIRTVSRGFCNQWLSRCRSPVRKCSGAPDQRNDAFPLGEVDGPITRMTPPAWRQAEQSISGRTGKASIWPTTGSATNAAAPSRGTRRG
ncbi:MAG: hypothetical protein JO001_21740 [Alphaproteobacteria bacterium]|nr:hypothetical protein [Alphaproteobacteria bacterium]